MEIRNDVAVPNVRRSGAKRVYPFNEMNAGDSIEFDDEQTFEKARRAARAHGIKHGQVFTSRKGYQSGEYTGEGGTIWRVE